MGTKCVVVALGMLVGITLVRGLRPNYLEHSRFSEDCEFGEKLSDGEFANANEVEEVERCEPDILQS